MRKLPLGSAILVSLSLGLSARADTVYSFDTQSTGDQMIALAGNPGTLVTSVGTQHFTIDLTTGTAAVTSFFQGNDLPDPFISGGFMSFNLYNTTTAGTVTRNPSGSYDIRFPLLFEVDITGGSLGAPAS